MSQQTFAIGGPEFLSFRQIIDTVMAATHTRRWIVEMSPAYLRILTLLMENTFKSFPLSIFWQDYLAVDRTCNLDTLPRLFGLMPVRFARQIEYLR